MLKLKLQYFGPWCQELAHWKRPWCWERFKAGGESDVREPGGWMASPIQWTWVWASFRSRWWTRKCGVLQSTGSQRVGYDWATGLNWSWAAKRQTQQSFSRARVRLVSTPLPESSLQAVQAHENLQERRRCFSFLETRCRLRLRQSSNSSPGSPRDALDHF